MSWRCEICDRDPVRVQRATERYDSLSHPAGIRGSGRGWNVPFMPGRQPWIRFDAAPLDMGCTLKAYAIHTCGDPVCIFRARRHGIPGRAYDEAAA